MSVLLAHTQDKIAIVDDDGTYEYVNAAGERILGFEPSALIGENVFEYIHPAERDVARRIFGSVIERSVPTTETHRYRHRASDGDWVWLESRFSNVSDESLGGYVVSSRDVTEQVEATRERRETRQLLEELTRTAPDVLWMFDGDWSEVLFVNPAFETIYGQSVEALESDPEQFIRSIHPEDRPCVRRAMERLSAGESVDMEYRVNAHRDFHRWVWVQGEPIVEDGEVVRIVGFSREVTSRRRRERQLAVMDNLLRHNLRNDMTVVLGNAEFIAKQGSDTVASRADVIRQTGEDLLDTAEKQRDVIKLLTGRAVRQQLDLVDVVQEASDVVRERYPAATVALELPETATVCALGEIQQAVIELLDNAIRHAEDENAPSVGVRIDAGDDKTELVVRDSGPPIPDREVQVLTGEREMCEMYHSTGLGLWLVYWTVDLSDGDVEFARTDQPGNTVTVTLHRSSETMALSQ